MARSDNAGTWQPWRDRPHIAPFLAIHCAQLRLMLQSPPRPDPQTEESES